MRSLRIRTTRPVTRPLSSVLFPGLLAAGANMYLFINRSSHSQTNNVITNKTRRVKRRTERIRRSVSNMTRKKTRCWNEKNEKTHGQHCRSRSIERNEILEWKEGFVSWKKKGFQRWVRWTMGGGWSFLFCGIALKYWTSEQVNKVSHALHALRCKTRKYQQVELSWAGVTEGAKGAKEEWSPRISSARCLLLTLPQHHFLGPTERVEKRREELGMRPLSWWAVAVLHLCK